MATKKTDAAKKPAARKRSTAGGIIVTESAIVITLDSASRRKAMRCLEKTGKITFAVKEHSITKLPQLLDNGKLID